MRIAKLDSDTMEIYEPPAIGGSIANLIADAYVGERLIIEDLGNRKRRLIVKVTDIFPLEFNIGQAVGFKIIKREGF
jgi:hypothetical protein